MSTLEARERARNRNRLCWHDAIQWQTKFLHDLLKDCHSVSLEVYGMRDKTWGGAFFMVREGKWSWTENFLREWPRQKYQINYKRTFVRRDLVLSKNGRPMWRRRSESTGAKLLPHTYDFVASFCEKRPLCECIVLPDGRTTPLVTQPATSSEIRSTLKQVLKRYPDAFVRRWITVGVKDGNRGKIIYRVAKMLADAGASADEIECAVRASEAFKSKSAPFSQGGQGRRWGEQEIQRMRKLAR
jgi:hypothetical protein